MSVKNKQIIDKVNEAFSVGKFEDFLSFCADDLEWTMVGERSVKGKEAIRQWMNSMAQEHPEPPQFSVANPVIAEGDFVVVRGEMTMKDKDGRLTPYSYCDIYRFHGGMIAELRSFVVKTEEKAEASGGTSR